MMTPVELRNTLNPKLSELVETLSQSSGYTPGTLWLEIIKSAQQAAIDLIVQARVSEYQRPAGLTESEAAAELDLFKGEARLRAMIDWNR